MAPTDREFQMLMTEVARVHERLDRQDATLRGVMEQLAAAKGGATVLRWLGFGSLGGVIAACAAFWVWLPRLNH